MNKTVVVFNLILQCSQRCFYQLDHSDLLLVAVGLDTGFHPPGTIGELPLAVDITG